MKKFIFVLIILCLGLNCPLATAAEEKKPSWDEEVRDRPLVILLDEIELTVNEDWSFVEKNHAQIKIQKDEAKECGEIPIYYNKSREEIQKVSAQTITPDGRKVTDVRIQDFRAYEGYPMYSDVMIKMITMPEAVVGAVLEYETTIFTKSLPIEKQFWDALYFSFDTPVKEYKVSVSFPKKLNIQSKAFNFQEKPQVEETATTITYKWHLKELKERELEEYMPPPTPETVDSGIEFSSLASWKEVNDWYSGLMQKNLVLSPEIEKQAKELTQDKKTVKEKVRAVLEYIQDNFRYVSMSLDVHSFEPHPTDEVFKNKYGDCKDLSLLCLGMLKVIGINSHLALFRDEYSTTDPQYDLPFPTLFNHVLVLVHDSLGDFYVDPLLKGYDLNEYPRSYDAAYAFVINEAGGQFARFPTVQEKTNQRISQSTVEIKPDGSAVIESEEIWDLDTSVEMRRNWQSLSEKEKEEFLQMINAQLTSGGKMLKCEWKDIEKRYGPVRGYTKYERPNTFAVAGDMLIVNQGACSRTIDFSKETRIYPIFFPFNAYDEELTTYIIPAGFSLENVPQELDLDIGFLHYLRSYKKEVENRLSVKNVSRFKRMQVPVTDYAKVREFFNQLSRQTNQSFILKKISTK